MGTDLLQAIQTGIKLKNVSERADRPEMGSKPSLHDSSEDIDMAEQLKRAMVNIRVLHSDDETSDDDSDWESD